MALIKKLYKKDRVLGSDSIQKLFLKKKKIGFTNINLILNHDVIMVLCAFCRSPYQKYVAKKNPAIH